MIWCDTHLSSRDCLPKPLYYFTACVLFWVSGLAGFGVVIGSDIQDKIIGSVVIVFLAYFGICNVFMILTGSRYVKSIKKEDSFFTLTNVFEKKTNFAVSDIFLVETSKFSIIDKFLTGFAKFAPGLDLILKDGSKFYITSYMEDIDTLKEYLLDKEKLSSTQEKENKKI
ncbi:hypothetical protein [Legionella drozanskii]|uniref:DUF304 domain-containing protein n=1 Tax=Legionella drozanskii LLAP-1 TaxID=1212489 RepID=A0A0W0T966_9GAMM|nr:hypothetical protein [Legionella drozanskii]KTC91781.1 hypothetical protein Ldro_0615 [Legionella drozanskii LLAP-1]